MLINHDQSRYIKNGKHLSSDINPNLVLKEKQKEKKQRNHN